MTSTSRTCLFAALMIGVATACGSDAAVPTSNSEAAVTTDVPEPTVTESAPASEPAPAPTTEDPRTTDEPTAVETTTTLPARAIQVVATIVGIEYYGACGNETFEVDGVTWYPLLPDEQLAVDEGDYAATESITEPAGLVRVAPPGPGDDVGTLFVFDDGLGRFVSDSGLIDLWVTTDERTYGYVC